MCVLTSISAGLQSAFALDEYPLLRFVDLFDTAPIQHPANSRHSHEWRNYPQNKMTVQITQGTLTKSIHVKRSLPRALHVDQP